MLRKSFAIAVLTFLGFCPNADASTHDNDLGRVYAAINPPKPAPAFVFQDAKGQTVSLKDFEGRYVLLNLWATWCGPCVHEMPSLDEAQHELGDDHFMVLPLSEDREGQSVVPHYYSRNNIRSLPVYVDSKGRAPSVFGANGLPTSLLIDPKGNEIGRVNGEVNWSSPESLALLKSLVTSQPKGL